VPSCIPILILANFLKMPMISVKLNWKFFFFFTSFFLKIKCIFRIIPTSAKCVIIQCRNGSR
jgi:hypothetical protein